jgi:hypothetical protein
MRSIAASTNARTGLRKMLQPNLLHDVEPASPVFKLILRSQCMNQRPGWLEDLPLELPDLLHELAAAFGQMARPQASPPHDEMKSLTLLRKRGGMLRIQHHPEVVRPAWKKVSARERPCLVTSASRLGLCAASRPNLRTHRARCRIQSL